VDGALEEGVGVVSEQAGRDEREGFAGPSKRGKKEGPIPLARFH
jgi:hypothetical protein